MVGFSAHVDLDLDTGVGVVVLTNGPWSPAPVAEFALRSVCAAITGGSPPEPPELDYAKVAGAERYAGTYRAPGGAATTSGALTIRADGDSLVLSEGAHSVPLVHTDDPEAFVAAEGSLGAFALRFERQGDEVVGVVHGPGRYVREKDGPPDDEPGPEPEESREDDAGDLELDEPEDAGLPEEYEAFIGHYRAHNPWFTNFRVVARDGDLVLIAPGGVEAPEAEPVLVPLPDGSFRVGETATPERIRFDTFVDGVAIRATLSGGHYYRTFTP